MSSSFDEFSAFRLELEIRFRRVVKLGVECGDDFVLQREEIFVKRARLGGGFDEGGVLGVEYGERRFGVGKRSLKSGKAANGVPTVILMGCYAKSVGRFIV